MIADVRNGRVASRRGCRSAVAAAAYRSGEKLTNHWDGLNHDYTKKGGVIHSEIMIPSHAPPGFADRSTLWNAVEEMEKSCKAQLAREINIALPSELSREQQIELVREYCRNRFVYAGMCADFAIHDTVGFVPKRETPTARLPPTRMYGIMMVLLICGIHRQTEELYK